ncbi:helix-turn-helix transcriptional regulator [Sphingomonas profundi]|uniref:helix-turn-helix transcriptional regulator n=1 Tax=Alterirhizorhabdus profundi TaxID=2681549 RepID=UPI0012E8398C|nr:hypothetical protein [Sphingomonas profundi]
MQAEAKRACPAAKAAEDDPLILLLEAIRVQIGASSLRLERVKDAAALAQAQVSQLAQRSRRQSEWERASAAKSRDDRTYDAEAAEERHWPIGIVGSAEFMLIGSGWQGGGRDHGRDNSTIAAIAPVLLACLSAATRMEAAEERAARAEAAIGTSAMGMVMLDPAGNICWTNDAADRLLAAGRGLRRNGNLLHATNLRDGVALQTAVSGGIKVGHTAPCVTLLVGADAASPSLSVTVVAMDREPGGIAHVLWLLDPARDVGDHVRAFARHFALSRSEALIAEHLLLGDTLDIAADAMRIKISTARTHLRSVFGKSGATSQTGLARLVMSSNPHVFPHNCTEIEDCATTV